MFEPIVPPPPPRSPRLGGHQPEEALRTNLRWSLGLHASLGAIILLKSLVFPGEPKEYKPSLRVDLVGLPDLLKKDMALVSPAAPQGATPEEPPPEKSAATSAEESAAPNEMVLQKKQSISERNRRRLEQLAREEKADRERRKKNNEALSRMKALARIRSQVASTSQEQADGILIKGNRISRGTNLTGDAVEQGQPNYLDLVKSRLQSTWELPVWLARQKLSAKVEIFIDPKGIVKNFRFTKPSGNAQFDDAVRRTISEAQPFPQPPKDEAASLLVHGISLGFPL